MKKNILFVLFSVAVLSFISAEPKKADEKMPSGPKPQGRPSVALVLAGGGAKGFAHLPVIELIERMDIPVDMVIGTSIGSIIGGMYSAGYTTTEILNNFNEVDWSPMFNDTAVSPYEETLEEHSINANLFSLNMGMDFSLKLGSGLSNGQNVYQLLKNMTLKYPSNVKFDELNIPFRAVVTDMLTGEALVLDEGDLAEAIRASMSLPSIFTPAEMDGYYFMDGGVRYNLAINVAKNMGYDIIIAVDISQKVRDNPEVYSSNPVVAMLNTITIAQYTATQAMYKDAALVVLPDISKFGTLDFKKADYIYNEGQKILADYEGPLEEIRKQIYPADYDAQGNRISPRKELKTRGVYRRRPNLIPTQLEIEGAIPQDLAYIKGRFHKILDKELTPENFENFMESIYLTGNYDSIRPRVIEDGDECIVNLKLKQKTQKVAKVIVGADFNQTIAPTMMTAFNLNLDVQLRGLTGPGSVISLSGKAINDFGASLYYMQPFNPNFFLQANVDFLDKRYPQMPLQNTLFSISDYTSYRTMDADLNVGFRTDNGNLIKFGGYYYYKSTSNLKCSVYDVYLDQVHDVIGYSAEKEAEYAVLYPDREIKYDDENDPFYAFLDDDMRDDVKDYVKNIASISSKNFGLYLEYVLDKRDSNTFAHKGFYLHSITDLDFSYSRKKVYDPALAVSLEMKGAIPCGKMVSINPSVFFGTDVLGKMKNNAFLLLGAGYNSYDRVYMPQNVDQDIVGCTKLAGELAVQIEPWSQLTILGGDAIIRLSGTVSSVVNEWSDLFPQMQWTGSAGFGIKIKDSYSAMLRAGAARSISGNVVPFMALDIGSISF